jgi:outer membrane receptor protein involved in Fe transport
MKTSKALSKQISLALTGLLTTGALLPGGAFAQNSSATLRGHISAAQGQMPTEVVATDTTTGFINKSKVNADGNYTLVGLIPGTYNIVASGNGSNASQTVAVHVGQSLTLNLSAATAAGTANTTNLKGVTVSAATLFETRTSEVAQNISQTQIANLPQNERNFLDFAQLVPGVTISHDPNSKSFAAGGQSANNVNVFIDGANQRNDILQGGLVGQDSSRGNPFSQEAIAEYRVLTQNYKAEYEQAGTAIISAVTKSGSNEFHGTIYDYFQNQGMIAQDSFDKKNHVKKPDYKREQRGFNLGGPIFKDQLEFFVNYEERKDVSNNTVSILDPRFSQYNGTFAAPFHEKSYFGKLSWQPNQDNDVDLSYSDRKDSEILGFGGTTTYDGRTQRENDVSDLVLKWESRGDIWTNDVLFDSGHYKWSPAAAEPDLVQQIYNPNVAILGGASNLQDKSQDQATIRDDLTFSGLSWHGDHTVKMGIKYASYSVNLQQSNNAVPSYTYQVGEGGDFDSPYQGVYTPLATGTQLHDDQLGAYIQDDWDINSRLQLNLGVRWDYETNGLDNNYVTPLDQYSTLQYFGLQNNISTGHERKSEKNDIQPRLGFSLDVSKDGDQSTTLFGGAGRYYSRTPFDWISQEPIHSQVPNYTFLFSPNGGDGTIKWDPSYLTAAGLDKLLASGTAGFSQEIDTINNNTKNPYTDQFSFGVKQVLGDWVGSLTLSRVLGYRQFTWIFANRQAGPYSYGDSFIHAPDSPYGTILTNAYKKTQASSVLVSLSKPYTTASGWGLDVAYTYQRTRQQGNDNYSLDYVNPSGYPGDYALVPKQNLVISGQVKGPWDTRLSGIFTYNSGLPYSYNKVVSLVCDYNCGQYINAKYGQKYINLDLAISKEFRWGKSQALQLRFDVFNVFNRDVINGYDSGFYDANFGQATSADPNQSRRLQVGARYSF